MPVNISYGTLSTAQNAGEVVSSTSFGGAGGVLSLNYFSATESDSYSFTARHVYTHSGKDDILYSNVLSLASSTSYKGALNYSSFINLVSSIELKYKPTPAALVVYPYLTSASGTLYLYARVIQSDASGVLSAGTVATVTSFSNGGSGVYFGANCACMLEEKSFGDAKVCVFYTKRVSEKTGSLYGRVLTVPYTKNTVTLGTEYKIADLPGEESTWTNIRAIKLSNNTIKIVCIPAGGKGVKSSYTVTISNDAITSSVDAQIDDMYLKLQSTNDTMSTIVDGEKLFLLQCGSKERGSTSYDQKIRSIIYDINGSVKKAVDADSYVSSAYNYYNRKISVMKYDDTTFMSIYSAQNDERPYPGTEIRFSVFNIYSPSEMYYDDSANVLIDLYRFVKDVHIVKPNNSDYKCIILGGLEYGSMYARTITFDYIKPEPPKPPVQKLDYLVVKKDGIFKKELATYVKVNGLWKTWTSDVGYAPVWAKVKGEWQHKLAPRVYGVVYYKESPTSSKVLSVNINTLNDFNSLVGPEGISEWSTTINGVRLTNSSENVIVGIEISDYITSIPDRFLCDCTYLTMKVEIPSSVTTIGDFFLAGCTSFNQPIAIPDGVSLGVDFLARCTAFNSAITLPSDLEEIKTAFLFNCTSFNQSIEVPQSVKAIGPLFLCNCFAFNQPLTLPDSVESIATAFLYRCTAFNNTITLSQNLKTIDTLFLGSCSSFNKPLTLPNSIESISGEFLAACDSLSGFNSILNIGSLSADVFEESDRTFRATDSSASLYTVGLYVEGDNVDDLMAKFPNTDQEGFTGYRNLIKYSIDTWGYITYWVGDSTTEYNTLPMTSDADWSVLCNRDSSASTTFNFRGVTVTKGSTNALRSVSIGKNVKYLPDYFLMYCTKLGDTNIDFSGLTGLGTFALSSAAQVDNAINGTLTLCPWSIQSYFMYFSNLKFELVQPTNTVNNLSDNFINSVKGFTGPIYCTQEFYNAINALTASQKNTTLISGGITYESYKSGIRLIGPYAQQVKALLPDRTSSPYRKLIVG